MAAPGRTAPVTRPTPGELYRRHVQRKKMIALIAGLLLLPVSLILIASFDDGPLGQAAQSLGLSVGGDQPAQPTSTSAVIVQAQSPTPTPFQPPRQTPLPTPTPTLFQPPRQTPLPTPTPTLFQPLRQTPRPTSAASGAGLGGTPTVAPTQRPSGLAPTGAPVSTPPGTLPVTGMPATALPGQAIGIVLLAISLILIAAGLWPVDEDR